MDSSERRARMYYSYVISAFMLALLATLGLSTIHLLFQERKGLDASDIVRLMERAYFKGLQAGYKMCASDVAASTYDLMRDDDL